MRLADIGGEFGFIERVKNFARASQCDELDVSIGDDAAVFQVPDGFDCVATTDLLVEGIHFRRDWSSPYLIGWKSAAVNLSDIAAMGARPTFALIGLSIPEDVTVEFLDLFYDGFTACAGYGVTIIGGDTNGSQAGLTISITQLGVVKRAECLRRSGARAGDILAVTGTLGDSAMGLWLLQTLGHMEAVRLWPGLVLRHLMPRPLVALGSFLSRNVNVNAAMDVSDGLCGDLAKLCQASGVGAILDIERLPVSDDLIRACSVNAKSSSEVAGTGGEDYELLLAISPDSINHVMFEMKQIGVELTEIGSIVGGTQIEFRQKDGTVTSNTASGWDHFKI